MDAMYVKLEGVVFIFLVFLYDKKMKDASMSVWIWALLSGNFAIHLFTHSYFDSYLLFSILKGKLEKEEINALKLTFSG